MLAKQPNTGIQWIPRNKADAFNNKISPILKT